MIKKILLVLVVLCVLAGAAGLGVLYWLVALEPGEEIAAANIRKILGRESPVLYNDGVTPLGVFFADAHRRYIDYREVPKHFVDALVAAEDNRFFSHFGFDIIGIGRAALKNIEARRVVQGGSTLTQQTAKNLFKRQDRSFRAKLIELIYALRLEYHYSKEQIIEFYVNQFYVSGTGHGLGVAARYYFDKEPRELGVIEAAFIAGSVKRPNAYNPFIKKTREAAARAEELALERTRHVLSRMRELGMLSDAEYREVADKAIPFNKGTVGFPLDYVMEMVTDAVASERVVQALMAHGIDNIATSGVRIITTVDRQTQRSTLAALRKHLSYLDVRLRGYDREAVQEELRLLNYGGDQEVEPGNFLFGTVRSIRRGQQAIEITVDFGRNLGSGIIDRAGLTSLVDARAKWRQHRWSEAGDADLQELLKQLQEQDRVWVSVREIDGEGAVRLDLERYPEVQGGAVVLRQGRVVGVAGGAENRFFNRAVYAKRTMGSSFKPFVYAAALQLGWDAADLLNNRRDVFVYQNQAYFPRPDHEIEHQDVSMSWAGVKSENLASVWLTAHLCDQLDRSEFLAVADQLGLSPRVVDGEPEPYRLFQTRVRDRYGIVMNQDLLRQAAYRKTVRTLEPDLIFEGLEAEYDAIKSLHYGLGFQGFLAQVNRDLADGDYSDGRESELHLRRALLRRNFLALEGMRQDLRAYFSERESNLPWTTLPPDPQGGSGARLYYHQPSDTYVFTRPVDVPGQSVAVDRMRLQQYLQGLSEGQRLDFVRRVKLGGVMSAAAFDLLSDHLQSEYERMKELLPYSMEVLEHVEDYRILVGLRYLLAFGEAIGIRSGLEAVLSFPLGSNSVTLLETTRIYETMVTGATTLFTEESGQINESLTIIDRIETEDGQVIYRPEAAIRTLVDPKTSLVLGHMLENTVKFGTGRYADQQVKLSGTGDETIDGLQLSIPLLGKTGTANRYTNASFFGYLPATGREGTGLSLEGGYSVGVYVGYDDNKPMRRTSTRVTGSLGALPAWSAIVRTIVEQESYAAHLDPVDLSFFGLMIKRPDLGQRNLAISENRGGAVQLPLQQVDPANRYQPSIMTFAATGADGTLQPRRSFTPFWLAAEN